MFATKTITPAFTQACRTPASTRVTNPARRFLATSTSKVLISDSIKSDHRSLEEARDKIYEAYKAGDADTQRRWQNQLTWELARHSIGEELVVYPAFEKHLPDGKEMAEADRGQHRMVKEHLAKFQVMTPDDKEFIPTLEALWVDLGNHIKEEESEDLPKLEQALNDEDSQALTTSFARTKHFIPTRSHPSAPDRPPYETVVGLMAAPMDKLRDMFAKFPVEKGGN
ncbi:hypothetical protein LTR36_001516 [Oleoguttula mirabilis]|uniref:Hemerythrin-like domain-containing protein n=1 Tax=Oleoguttula mirabilis TaxID=1507867 RepID=A0AAV9JN56_9PEZI|nr:hypothetical protein LTR36_001516 [Oleoguttula mirabilis]